MALKQFIAYYCSACETISETSSILDQDASCHHADFIPASKPTRFTHKCGVCSKRIWNVFNLIKCLGCKTIAHKSCVVPAKEVIEMNSVRAAKEFDFATISDASLDTPRAWAYENCLSCESLL